MVATLGICIILAFDKESLCRCGILKSSKYGIAIANGGDPQDHEDYPCNYKTGFIKATEATAALDLIL